MILDALKKRMYRGNDKAPGRWIKELPAMVWGLRTQPSCNTVVSPYFMVYGTEVVLPAYIEFRSPRVENYNEDQVTEKHELEVNSAEERRLDSCIRTTKYLAVLRRYYNKNVQERFFVVGDLLLNGRLAKMVSTNWQLHGKGHTSSMLLHDLPCTDLQDLTALTCLTLFISTNLGVFTPNSQL
jgi:hypothetical protein